MRLFIDCFKVKIMIYFNRRVIKNKKKKVSVRVNIMKLNGEIQTFNESVTKLRKASKTSDLTAGG